MRATRCGLGLLVGLVLAGVTTEPAHAEGFALDLTAPGSFAGWAGNGLYSDEIVPFNQGGTIETWVLPQALSTGAPRVLVSSENDFIFYLTDSGRLGMTVELGPGNWHHYSTPTPVLTMGAWQHVAITYDLTTLRFFVDAAEVHSVIATPGGPIWGAHNIQLGSSGNRGAQDAQTSFLRGHLDDTRVWSTIRTSAQLAATMCSGDVVDPSSIASWQWEQSALDDVASIPCPLHAGATYSLTGPTCGGPWLALGAGLPGTSGIPSLSGSGELVAGTPVALVLTAAKPFAPCYLVIGIVSLSVPFKGGVLVPAPDLLFPQTVDFSGKASFGGLWPPGIPAGFKLYFQYWIVDAAGPQGFAASNGVSGTTP